MWFEVNLICKKVKVWSVKGWIWNANSICRVS